MLYAVVMWKKRFGTNQPLTYPAPDISSVLPGPMPMEMVASERSLMMFLSALATMAATSSMRA
jgi:hypothetical protein